MQGYVYVLMSPAFPSLLKIGRTTKSPQDRANELSTTGSPEKFVVVHSVISKNCVLLEQALHEYYKDKRYNQNREFFEIQVADVIQKIDEIITENNLQLTSDDLTKTEEVIEVLLYEILFGMEYCASRIGLLPVDGGYKNTENGREIACSVEEYLDSSVFKKNIIDYYQSRSQKEVIKLNRCEGLLGEYVQWGFANGHYKILNASRFKVTRDFYEKSSYIIGDRLEHLVSEFVRRHTNSFIPLFCLTEDRQTFMSTFEYGSDRSLHLPIDAFADIKYQVFEIYEALKVESSENISKNNHAIIELENLLETAPKEISDFWRKKLGDFKSRYEKLMQDDLMDLEFAELGFYPCVTDYSEIINGNIKKIQKHIESASVRRSYDGKI